MRILILMKIKMNGKNLKTKILKKTRIVKTAMTMKKKQKMKKMMRTKRRVRSTTQTLTWISKKTTRAFSMYKSSSR